MTIRADHEFYDGFDFYLQQVLRAHIDKARDVATGLSLRVRAMRGIPVGWVEMVDDDAYSLVVANACHQVDVALVNSINHAGFDREWALARVISFKEQVASAVDNVRHGRMSAVLLN